MQSHIPETEVLERDLGVVYSHIKYAYIHIYMFKHDKDAIINDT